MEFMKELFYRDAYLKEFDAEVIFCDRTEEAYEIILSDTAFYPEGGGQPGDHGTLNGIEVIDTRTRKGEIVHLTREPIELGTQVHGVIDWQRRWDHMQQHCGEHILSGTIHRNFGYENVGFHMGDDVVTIDFDGPLTWEQLQDMETKANEVVMNNVEVEISYPDEETLKHLEYRSKKELTGVVRIVTIPGADVCACCGTHPARTGEVGLIKVLSLAAHKSGVRIEMISGLRALKAVQKITDQNLEVSHLLSARLYETGDAVKRLQEELLETRKQRNELALRMMETRLDSIRENEELVIDFETAVDTRTLREFANTVVETKHAGTCAALSIDEDAVHYVMISKTVDLRSLAKEMNTGLNGRGGGSPEMIQGMFHAEKEEIESVLNKLIKKEA